MEIRQALRTLKMACERKGLHLHDTSNLKPDDSLLEYITISIWLNPVWLYPGVPFFDAEQDV